MKPSQPCAAFDKIDSQIGSLIRRGRLSARTAAALQGRSRRRDRRRRERLTAVRLIIHRSGAQQKVRQNRNTLRRIESLAIRLLALQHRSITTVRLNPRELWPCRSLLDNLLLHSRPFGCCQVAIALKSVERRHFMAKYLERNLFHIFHLSDQTFIQRKPQHTDAVRFPKKLPS